MDYDTLPIGILLSGPSPAIRVLHDLLIDDCDVLCNLVMYVMNGRGRLRNSRGEVLNILDEECVFQAAVDHYLQWLTDVERENMCFCALTSALARVTFVELPPSVLAVIAAFIYSTSARS